MPAAAGRSRHRASASIVPLLALLVVQGCGFQLQGRVPLPSTLKSTWIDTEDDQTDFVLGLRRALRASGAQLAPRRDAATSVLRIGRDTLTERVLSVSGGNIPREVELIYTVRLEVQAGGRTLLPDQQFVVLRDLSFNESLLLAKEREQEVLRAALARDLVGVVMRRLSSLP